MTENRPAVDAAQFAELCRILESVNERPLSEYIADKEKGWTAERTLRNEHREWALYILSELELSIQAGSDPGKFVKAMGIPSSTFT
ncbi:hypothetical protein QIS99_09020 [Streptomyces sp. B-S-A8]|uniref:Uncharacterized protein n=1 Tax=Streptomyces solicavernae TaxID=3043614 RepID=A0ABT6RPW4_9ACTN|nr:hypothetical protein [Streptomyces sp. B-S-A8]MDI3386355.1 hypothetical protein [Streptomyces sp. B-S-A8]